MIFNKYYSLPQPHFNHLQTDVDDFDEDLETPNKRLRRNVTSTPSTDNTVKPQMSAIASKAKLIDSLNLKQFDLINDDPTIWIAGFEAAAKKHGDLDEIGCAILFHLLDDDCLTWHFGYRRANPIFIWSDYKGEFVDEMNTRFLSKLSMLKQKHEGTQTYTDYVDQQIKIYKSFFPKMTDNDLILTLLAGLPNNAQKDLNEFRSVGLNAFKSFCAILDKDKK